MPPPSCSQRPSRRDQAARWDSHAKQLGEAATPVVPTDAVALELVQTCNQSN